MLDVEFASLLGVEVLVRQVLAVVACLQCRSRLFVVIWSVAFELWINLHMYVHYGMRNQVEQR